MLTSIAVLLLHPFSLYRLISRDGSLAFEVICVLVASLCTGDAITRLGLALSWLQHLTAWNYIALFSGLACALSVRYVYQKSAAEAASSASPATQFLPPLLFPSRTTHTRFFPKKHSFSYSYLYVGIPVGWKGRCGSLLSADVETLTEAKQRHGWFHVLADDYLEGRASASGLAGKLSDYLKGQGVDSAVWSFAYLVTAPRFLGYSFNPVSFWYLYNKDRKLVMMILEVNNTFDERRIYLLKRDQKDQNRNSESSTFSDTWAKDFHVSPFNSRKGTYSLKAADPLAGQHQGSLQVDNAITLTSSQDHVKLVARVSSTTAAVSPCDMSSCSTARFLFKYGWIGFLTSPRIVYEASRLFFKRNLHVWFRPEVFNTSIGRASTAEEEAIERVFRQYLQNLVRNFPQPVRLTYIPPTRMSGHDTMQSLSAGLKDEHTVPELTFRILTPAFYSRFVHYAHTLEALDREGPQTIALNRTVEINNMALMTRIIQDQPRAAARSSRNCNDAILPGTATLDRWRWRVLQMLRSPVAEQAYPHNHLLRPPGSVPPVVGREGAGARKPTHSVITDIRTFGLSALDQSVRDSDALAAAGAYRRAVTRLFLAERFAFGQIWLVKLADLICRAMLVWFACAALRGVRGADGGAESPREMLWRSYGWMRVCVVAGLLHLWSIAKG